MEETKKKVLTYEEEADLAAKIAEKVGEEAPEQVFDVMQLTADLLFGGRYRLTLNQ